MLFPLYLLVVGIAHAACPNCQQSCPCSSRTTASPPIQQPPCIGFDTRYMATSLDDAMFNFPNLVNSQGAPLFDKSVETSAASANRGSGGASGDIISPFIMRPAGESAMEPAKTIDRMIAPTPSGSCVTHECLSCKLAIVNGFLDNSNEKDQELLGTRVRLEQETGLSMGSCGQASTPTTTRRPQSKWQRTQERKAREIIAMLTAYSRKKRAIVSAPHPFPYVLHNLTTSKTSLDNSTQTMDSLLGVTTQIGCDYRKGSALSTNQGYSGLCNLCWQWRRLPEQYFPNYVNEVACDRSDCGCLSGFGQCMPVTRILNVLKNIGTKENPNWQEATIDTIATCECQVGLSSPLLAFVAK